jgi:hypothetical protein
MKNKTILGLISASLFAIVLTACSDDQPEPAKTEKNVATSKVKASKDNDVDYGEASDTVKQQFIKTFSKNCVTRELKNSVNKDTDEKRFTESCSCIAEHIAEDLADVDAEKYLDDHEDTHTLQIKFDAGAFFCLQNKPQPKGPHLFGK